MTDSTSLASSVPKQDLSLAAVIRQCLDHVLDNGIEGSLVQFEGGNTVDEVLPTVLGRQQTSARRLFSVYVDGDQAVSSVDAYLQALDPRQWRRIHAADLGILERVQTLRVAFARIDTQKFPALAQLLPSLYSRVAAGGILLLERCDEEDLLELRRFLDGQGCHASAPMQWHLGEGIIGIQKIESVGEVEVERYDYVPKGFFDPGLLKHFPSALPVNPWAVGWAYLRPSTPHVYRSDCRYDGPFFIGNASYEEAVCLHEVARQFRGGRGLEIGSHFGWTSAHLQAAGLDMDYIDPGFVGQERQDQVAGVLAAVNAPGTWRFWPGLSPELVPVAAAADPRPYSFVFIDGDHDGSAPIRDALEAEKYCGHDAVIAFHDMASPHVAGALSALGERGWSTCIFNTMQILGFAWRGNATIPLHVPDLNTTPVYEPHLVGWHT